MDKKKILIVDDDQAFSYIMKKNLEKSGEYDVVSEMRGEEALYRARKENPDIILLDLIIPDRDGLSVLRDLKSDRKTARIPVFMLTGVMDREAKIEAARLYCEHYFTKPVELGVLKAKIQDVLKMREVPGKDKEAMVKKMPVKPLKKKEVKAERNGKKVLIIDDEGDTCYLLEKYLEPLGFDVWSCTDSVKAFLLFQSVNPDIVLLDLVMRNVDGMHILAEIKETKSKAKVIIMTGVRDDKIFKDAARLGADDIIVKPFSLDQIRATITKNLEVL